MAKVLVCDDDASVRLLLRKVLEADRHEVHEAQTGLEALRQIEALEPTVVVLDIRMPELDGLGVLERLRSRSDRERFGVILLTASVSDADVHRGWKLGTDAYIQKPFDPSELLQLVQDLSWRKRRTQRAVFRQEIGEIQPRPLG